MLQCGAWQPCRWASLSLARSFWGANQVAWDAVLVAVRNRLWQHRRRLGRRSWWMWGTSGSTVRASLWWYGQRKKLGRSEVANGEGSCARLAWSRRRSRYWELRLWRSYSVLSGLRQRSISGQRKCDERGGLPALCPEPWLKMGRLGMVDCRDGGNWIWALVGCRVVLRSLLMFRTVHRRSFGIGWNGGETKGWYSWWTEV